MNEPFSLRKLFDLSPVGFYKVIGLSIKGSIIILVILGVVWIKNLMFPKPVSNVNQPHITVSEGGTVQYTNIQKSEKEKLWWIPSPFVELFGEKTDKNKGINVGARFGARWEF